MKWKPYPEYKPSGVEWLGEIPAHWNIRKLKHISDTNFSSVDKHSLEGEKPVRLCNYVDVYHHDHITSEINFMEATATADEIRRFTIKRGDVLVTKDSEEWDDIAVPAHVDEDLDGVLCGYHLAHIRPPANQLEGRYLFRAFAARGINDQFRVEATGITRYGLSKYGLDNALFLVPPLIEQRAIASFLDRETARIDALIAKKERQIELLQEKRAALISHTVTRGFNPKAPLKNSGVEWIGKIPAHWEVIKTKYVAALRSGHTPSRQHPEYWENCTLPWFSLADVWQLRDGRREYLGETSEKISELGLANSAADRLPAGTVIVSRTASVGFSGIMPVPMATTQDFVNWVCGPRIKPEYLLYVFRSMGHEFKRLTMGSTHQTIYMPDAAGFQTPLPPVKEQEKIVDVIQKSKSHIDRLEDLLNQSMEKLHEYRTALISSAVTGKIDVRGEVA
jgi:type I restriction enzyme S subunit